MCEHRRPRSSSAPSHEPECPRGARPAGSALNSALLTGKGRPGFQEGGSHGKGHHESRTEQSPLVSVLPAVTFQGYFTESPLTSLQGVSQPPKKRSELGEAAAHSGLEAAEGWSAAPEDRPQPCSPPRLCAHDPAVCVVFAGRGRKAEVELSH